MTTSPLNPADAAQVLNDIFVKNADRPSENRMEMNYEELRLTEYDRDHIDTMVSLMAQGSIFRVGLATS